MIFETFLKIEKHISFGGVYFLFQLVLESKIYAITSSKKLVFGQHNNIAKSQNKILKVFFSHRKDFCLHKKI